MESTLRERLSRSATVRWSTWLEIPWPGSYVRFRLRARPGECYLLLSGQPGTTATPPRVKDAARHYPLSEVGVLVVADRSESPRPKGQPGGPGRPDGTWIAVSLPAEVDIANADRVRAQLLAALGRGCPLIIVDMSRTTFCDCAGVSILLGAGNQALRDGAEMRIVARAEPVLRMFELTGLQLALHVYGTTAEALRGPPGAGGAVVLTLPLAAARLSRRQRTDAG
jgi:anti-anti-sigma factor